MQVDLNKGVNLRVEGEIGKHNTLPIEYLVKLAENFRNYCMILQSINLKLMGQLI